MNNLYYVKIGDNNWIKSCTVGHVNLLVWVPSELTLTRILAEAKIFTDYKDAKKAAKEFGGTVYAPKGKLVPVNDEEVE